MLQSLHSLLEPTTIIKTIGLAGVLLFAFAESGLFFGFFLPGDSLLFTAGFLASQGFLSPFWLFVGAFVAAVAGDSVGYAFGKHVGPAIFKKEHSFFFNKRYIARSQEFFEKYGKKAIVLSRFVPIVRTFTPIMAGVGRMEYRTFLVYNIVGGLMWSVGLSALGYLFGNVLPDAEHYITPVVVLIIVVSAIPPVREYLRTRKG